MTKNCQWFKFSTWQSSGILISFWHAGYKSYDTFGNGGTSEKGDRIWWTGSYLVAFLHFHFILLPSWQLDIFHFLFLWMSYPKRASHCYAVGESWSPHLLLWRWASIVNDFNLATVQPIIAVRANPHLSTIISIPGAGCSYWKYQCPQCHLCWDPKHTFRKHNIGIEKYWNYKII